MQVIGQGSFGRVFLVRRAGGAGLFLHHHHHDQEGDAGAFYAMKVLRKVDVARRHQVSMLCSCPAAAAAVGWPKDPHL